MMMLGCLAARMPPHHSHPCLAWGRVAFPVHSWGRGEEPVSGRRGVQTGRERWEGGREVGGRERGGREGGGREKRGERERERWEGERGER